MGPTAQSADAVIPPESATGTREAWAGREATMRKIFWRVVPFIVGCYFISYLDRINSGFAALQMCTERDISLTAYGLGSGLFLVSNFLFAVPANAGLQKLGARRWIAVLMVVWGAISMAMTLVSGPISFYVLRFLLGAAEAGFFPGMIFYISCWFPADYRARVSAIFMLAIPLSNFVGSAVSGALMELNAGGLSAWQWLFLIEGAPSVLMGVGFLGLMADRPRDVRWLTEAQKRGIYGEFALEEQNKVAREPMPFLRLIMNRQVIGMALTYCGVMSVGVSLSLWQPQLIKAFGLTNFQTGLLSSIPFGVATLAMVWWARRSDRHAERVWHTAIPLALSALAMLATFISGSLIVMIVLLSLMQIGSQSAKGPLWALATQWMSAANVAVALAFVSAVGSMGTALTTYLFGVIRQQTGSYELALLPLIAISLLGVPALFLSRPTVRTRRSEASKRFFF